MSVTKKNCGNTWLFDRIGERTGLVDDMRTCFPENWDTLLSMAYYSALRLVIPPEVMQKDFLTWAKEHVLACAAPETQPEAFDSESSDPEAFDSESSDPEEIEEDLKAKCEQAMSVVTQARTDQFLELRAARVSDDAFWCRTVVPERRRMSEEEMRTMPNIAVLVGKNSKLPGCYKTIEGCVPDEGMMASMAEVLEKKDAIAVYPIVDRTLYSSALVDALVEQEVTCVLGVPTGTRFVRDMITEHETHPTYPYAFNEELGMYVFSRRMYWPEGSDPEDRLRENPKGTVYVHLYFDPDRTYRDYQTRKKKLARMLRQLEDGEASMLPDAPWRTYFTKGDMRADGRPVFEQNSGVVERESIRVGFSALLTNGIESAKEAMDAYRMRDMYRNMAQAFSANRKNEDERDAQIFVDYLGAMYLATVIEAMNNNDLTKELSLRDLFLSLEYIACWEMPGKPIRYGKVNKKQNYLYSLLGMLPPGI